MRIPEKVRKTTGRLITAGHGTNPGDWFSVVCLPWKFRFKAKSENESWKLLRGESLFLVDVVTAMPLGTMTLIGRHHADHIRAMMLNVTKTMGFPRRGFVVEAKGWKSHPSKVTWGGKRIDHAAFAVILRRGLEIDFSPGKMNLSAVESLISHIQRFCAGDQLLCDQSVSDRIRQAHNGEPSALSYFPSVHEWELRVNGILKDFSELEPHGAILKGVSPVEAFRGGIQTRPLVKSIDTVRYFPTHIFAATVKEGGIKLRLHDRVYHYRSRCLSKLNNINVFVLCNIIALESVSVWDRRTDKHFHCTL